MKRCSMSLIVREMHRNTTMRYHLILVRMAAVNKPTNNKCWKVHGEKETFVHCWEEWRLKTVWRVLKKLNMVLPYKPVILLLSVFQRNPKLIQKNYMHPYVHCSAIYNSQEWKQPKWSSKDKWIKKLRYIYMVFPEGIQPYNMKKRDIYWRRYKIQETLYIGRWCLSLLQSRHLGTSHSSPNCHQLPHHIFLNLIDGLKSLPFQRWF